MISLLSLIHFGNDQRMATCVQMKMALLIFCYIIFLPHLVPAAALPPPSSRNATAVTVSGILGHSILLPCNLSTNSSGSDRAVLILWYKHGIDTPIYSVDGRDSKITEGDHWSSDLVLERRANFTWPATSEESSRIKATAESSGLVLHSLVVGDAAIYRCRVDYREAQTRNLLINLTVIVPPSTPVIKNEEGDVVSSMAGPYLEGQTLKLKCESHTGNPPARVIWYRNGELWDSSFRVYPNGTVSNSVSLSLLRRSDVNTILSCEASNNNVTDAASAFVIVDLLLPPLDVRISGAEDSLIAWEETNLTCQTTGSRPPPVLSWFIGHQRITNCIETISPDGNVTTSVLPYRPQVSDFEKPVRCRVDNLKLPTLPLEASQTINLQFPPQIAIEMRDSNSTIIRGNVTVGNDVFLHCSVYARPNSYKMEWMHNEEKVSSNTITGVYVKGNTLTLRRITSAHSGSYWCEAWNSIGRNHSQHVTIDVIRTPECNFNGTRVHYVEVGESIELTCDVTAHPMPNIHHWALKRSGHLRGLNVNDSSMVYNMWSITDYGIIQCRASNDAGMQDSPCLFLLKPPGPPDPPGNCTIQSESTETVRVMCQPGSDHGSNQSYSLLVFNRSQMLVENTTLVEPSFSISGLESGREYFGIIYSFNAKGRSHLRNLTLHSINEPMGQPTIAESGDKRATPLMTPTISTVIGVVAAVLSIALLVLGIVCRPKVCRSRTPSPVDHLAGSTVEMEYYHQVHHPPRAKRQLINGPNAPDRPNGPNDSNEPNRVASEPLIIVGPMASSIISDAAVTFPLDRIASTNQQSLPFQFL